VLDLRAKGGDKRRKLAARLYDCLGHAVAEFIARGGADGEAPAASGSRP
jgi:hypothetical protein